MLAFAFTLGGACRTERRMAGWAVDQLADGDRLSMGAVGIHHTTALPAQNRVVDAAGWANVCVAVGTGALAIGTFWLAWQSRASVNEARKQTWISQRSVEAAEAGTKAALHTAGAARAAVVESARSRSDARAPSVVALLEPVRWPPLWDRSRHGIPDANELRLLDSMSIHRSVELDGSEEFLFEQDAETFLWFRMRGLLVNEGRTSARVRLDGEARFLEEHSPFQSEFAMGTVQAQPPASPRLPAQVGTYVPESGLSAEYVLRPDEEAVFEWAAGHTLREWADAHADPAPNGRPNDNGRMFFSITVFDYAASGVTEWIFVEAAGRPIEPVPGRGASWRPASSTSMVHVAYPNVRHYREDDLPAPAPPWSSEDS